MFQSERVVYILRKRECVCLSCRKTLSVLKFYPTCFFSPQQALLKDVESQLQTAGCACPAGVLISFLAPVCLERNRWAVKLCGTLLSTGAGRKMVETVTHVIRVPHLLPTPQLCSSALSSQQWEERPGSMHDQDPCRLCRGRALRAGSRGGEQVFQCLLGSRENSRVWGLAGSVNVCLPLVSLSSR